MTDAMSWDGVSGSGKDTLITTASTALTNANSAQAAANTANSALADIAADNKLTPAEKKSVRKEWDAIYAERAGIRAQADSFGITTEKTNYDNDFQALGTYLNGGTAYTIGSTPPSWIADANLSTTTTVVGATFRANWSNLYSDRQALLNKISAEAAKRADWANVSGSGKPADNATKNTIYQQSATPSGATNGDIWIDTSLTPNVEKILISGSWQIAATVGATFNTGQAGSITGQITPSNVSTYIANAAIGAAQIGSIELVGESAFKVRTNNTLGARMDMDSRRIKIFDASGTLRVQLGDLTA
jgi:hypothetical protein